MFKCHSVWTPSVILGRLRGASIYSGLNIMYWIAASWLTYPKAVVRFSLVIMMWCTLHLFVYATMIP